MNCQTSLQLMAFPPEGDGVPQEDTRSCSARARKRIRMPEKAGDRSFASPNSFVFRKSTAKTPPRAVNVSDPIYISEEVKFDFYTELTN